MSSGRTASLPFDVQVQSLNGGLTNRLWLVKFKRPCGVDNAHPGSKFGSPHAVVVRVFGDGTERLIDRAMEGHAIEELNALRPPPALSPA